MRPDGASKRSQFYFAPSGASGPDCAVTYDFFSPPKPLESREKVYTDPTTSELHALREKEVREEIARRLRRVCECFSEEDFEKLVRKMAERQLRDERRLIW